MNPGRNIPNCRILENTFRISGWSTDGRSVLISFQWHAAQLASSASQHNIIPAQNRQSAALLDSG